MHSLFQLNWQTFDLSATIKVALGLIVMMSLTELTGETWLATGLVVLFAWFTNVPGPLKDRIGGMLAFALGASVMTLLFGQLELAVWPNTVAIAVIAFLGTAALAWGMRSFMVGWALICWAIYGPFLVESTSVANCLLAIIAGTGVLIGLNALGERLADRRDDTDQAPVDKQKSTEAPGTDFIIAYAITVALILAVTTYYGWIELETDPTLMAGGAFFVIGFDVQKTWIAGIGRIMGLVGGALVGLLIGNLLEPGYLLSAIMITACGLSFGTVGLHPGAWMFFFMIFVAISWPQLEPEAFQLAANERFYGEIMGVAAAMLALVFLQWWQNRRHRPGTAG